MSVPFVDLVGVGLNATDTVIPLLHYPDRGSKIEYTTETVMPGGQVASAVVACQTWGLRTRYVGKLGDDDAARLHEREFARLGVDARLIHVPNAASPKSLILVDAAGERTVLCRRDARMTLLPEELHREWVINARALHLDGHDTAAAACAARWAREAGVPVVADLDELYPGLDELLPQIDYLIVNQDFPSRLMQEPDPERALRRMHAEFRPQLTATTLGHDGVLAFDGNTFHHRTAFEVRVADSTGAGDIFRAGFIYGLLQGWPLERQLDFACAAAALNCMSVGARGGIHAVETVESLLANSPRYPASSPLAATV